MSMSTIARYSTSLQVSKALLIAIGFCVTVLLWVHFGSHLTLVAVIPWAIGLIILGATDLEHHMLPKRVTYITGLTTMAALAITAVASHDWTRLGIAGICALAATVLYGVIWLIFPRSLGFGDVRLVALTSLMLGWLDPMLVFVGLFAGQFACLFAVAILAATRRVTRSTEIPLGAFIAAAGVATAIALGR